MGRSTSVLVLAISGLSACGSGDLVDVSAGSSGHACEFEHESGEHSWVDVEPLPAIDAVGGLALATVRVVGHDPICLPSLVVGRFRRFCSVEIVDVLAGRGIRKGDVVSAVCAVRWGEKVEVADFAKDPAWTSPVDPPEIGTEMPVLLGRFSVGPPREHEIVGDDSFSMRRVVVDTKAMTVAYLPGTWAQSGAEKAIPIDGLTAAWDKVVGFDSSAPTSNTASASSSAELPSPTTSAPSLSSGEATDETTATSLP